MWYTKWVIPARIVYIIEEYRFVTGVIFIMLVMAVITPLISRLDSIMTERSTNIASVYSPPEYPIINKQSIPEVSAVPQQYLTVGAETWPIQGLVTTEFGVPHRPWQKTHTGMDISSRARSGITDIKAFRGGTVINTIRQRGGYGNHIIIDHGNGLISLYAHMYSISAVEGQQVRPGDSIGKEGSTGTSTGTHVHFEIRQDGKPVNPRKYIAGNP